ncbi:hypothetical protein Pan189_17570 [Stratiformator vulcanicus]|uniref:Endonuclease/exonuclease/phosphatase domain-containing protein n=2 Tax=Stratiformator vulcanicus TaxID=2527980 RepID=A0A517R0M0_9PLAN|nr:hypothetical protein Pan189_17570 [Stratiformator vulcanicus]
MFVIDGSQRKPAEPRSWFSQNESAIPADQSLNLVSFNIHYGKDDIDSASMPSIRELIAAQDPDVVVLNEVPNPFGRSGSTVDRLGELLSLNSFFLPVERRWWHDHVGNALLLEFIPKSIVQIPLPCSREKGFRGAAVTTVPWGEREFRIISVHADSQEDNSEHLRILGELFMATETPCILAGDLNAQIGDEILSELIAAGAIDAATEMGLEQADQLIDHILVRGVTVEDAGMEQTTASDHPLLWARLALPARAIESDSSAGSTQLPPR